MTSMTSEVSLSELIQRLHALSPAPQPASLRASPSPSKSGPVSGFHIHPSFSPSLLSSVAARAGLPPLTPPTPSPQSSSSIRPRSTDAFLRSLLARHERSVAAKAAALKSPSGIQSPDSSAPATPAHASPLAPNDTSSVVPTSSTSAAASRALLNSLIYRYTGTALIHKRTRSPSRLASCRKASPHTKSPNHEARLPSPGQSSASSPLPARTPTLPTPSPHSVAAAPPSAFSTPAPSTSRHHRQLFTRSASSIAPLSVASPSASSPSAAPPSVFRAKRSSSSAGGTARQRASVEVEKAQIRAAAEAARNAAQATTLAASLLLNATQHSAAPLDAESGVQVKKERLSGALDFAPPGAVELLRLSSAGDKATSAQHDTSDTQQSKRRRGDRAVAVPSRKRKPRVDDTGARATKRRAAKPAAASKRQPQAAEQRGHDVQYDVIDNRGDTSESADSSTDDSGRSYDSYDSDDSHSHTLQHLTKADSHGASLLSAARSNSLAAAARLSSPLMHNVALVSSASFGLPGLSSGLTSLARSSARGGGLRGSPLLN